MYTSAVTLPSAQRALLTTILRQRAPFSIVEQGTTLAESGAVVECSRSGSTVHGVVKGDGDELRTVRIAVPSSRTISAECSCSSSDDMREQWCAHAVAVLVRGWELGFSGAEATSSDELRPAWRAPGATEIATTLTGLASASAEERLDPLPLSLDVTLVSGGCMVTAFRGTTPVEPMQAEGVLLSNGRALDQIVLRHLDDHARWVEEEHGWLLESDTALTHFFGLLPEYEQEQVSSRKRTLRRSSDFLNAVLTIEWSKPGAELKMEWQLPNGSRIPRKEPVAGRTQAWTIIEDTLYQLSPAATRLAQIVNDGETLEIPRSRVGPLLAVLADGTGISPYVEVLNPHLQPTPQIVPGTPHVALERLDEPNDHFASQQKVSLKATLTFQYPEPPSGENVVIIPDREHEALCRSALTKLGFVIRADQSGFSIEGDEALDLIHGGESIFPEGWEIEGFSAIRRSLKFANLAVRISLGDGAAVEASKRTGEPIDWFACEVTLLQNQSPVPLSTLFRHGSSGNERWVRLDTGAFAKVPGGGISHLKATLGLIDMNFRMSHSISAKVGSAQAVSLLGFEDSEFQVVASPTLSALSKKWKNFTTITPKKAPKQFTGKLRPYQEEGLSWLHFLKEFGFGGILADEMGLGKTVQTLAILSSEYAPRKKSEVPTLPSLIVCPTSVLMNWVYEARRFAPHLKVLLLHGPQRKEWFQRLSEFDLVVTSYALARLDKLDIERQKFHFLILDEAQNIKNPSAATTSAVKGLRAKHRLALSGTPTENRPLELWSIMDFVMPGYLGSLDFFRTYIEKPILEHGTSSSVVKLLNRKTKPFILRRTKAEVERELPPKIESVVHVEMTEQQRDLYNQIVAEVKPSLFAQIEKKGVRGATVSILAALLRLRQVCNHPNSIPALRDVPGYDSGKFSLCKEIVEEAVQSGRKILLFCQFLEMLHLIRSWLEEAGIRHLYLDGSTKNRQDLVDSFNADPDIKLFLISLKAGGTGVNLTGADTVIIYDPWWNPAVEHQAVDRAHRIGQKKAVTVYRLVTEGSVEQKIMDLKSRKTKIVNALVNERGLSTISLSKADLEQLLEPVESIMKPTDTAEG